MDQDRVWLILSGTAGIITPIIAFTCVLLSIDSYPLFSWTDNALSDLGAVEGITSTLFSCGLMASGVLALVFTTGLFELLHEKIVGRIGASLFALASLALLAMGIFPESAKPMHYYASVAFFAFSPMAMLVIATAFFNVQKVKMGLFTLITAIIAVAPWTMQFSIRYVPNVAIPETISALSALTWSIVLGISILSKVAQRQN